MKEPESQAEVANWCVVNALRLPNELIVSITTKLMQHLTKEEREKVLSLFNVVGQSEQLLAVAEYVYNHFDDSSTKTAKDYLDDFISQ